MNSATLKNFALALGLGLALTGVTFAQQDTAPIQGNAGQAPQPARATSGPASATSTSNTASPATPAAQKTPQTDTTRPNTDQASPQTDQSSAQTDRPKTVLIGGGDDANAYDPVLEPPPLPNTKPTLIGGTAAHIDHVRNRLTIRPFGGGAKVKVMIDSRTHIYRNGRPATVLGIQQGDRVYVDTMLDGSQILAKNVRVENETGPAEVRGQVTAVNLENGTVSVRDELSAKPVTFTLDGSTHYSAFTGTATSADLQPGSLVDVQFAPSREKHDKAEEVIVLAKPGESYVFSGVVTNVDLRTSTLALENSSDNETYELHFDPSSLDDRSKLKVGAELTAHAVFNGKQYNANDLQFQQTSGSDSKE